MLLVLAEIGKILVSVGLMLELGIQTWAMWLQV